MMPAIFSSWRWAASGGMPPPATMTAGAVARGAAGAAAFSGAEPSAGGAAAVPGAEGRAPSAAVRPGAEGLSREPGPEAGAVEPGFAAACAAAISAAISATVRVGRKSGTISSGGVSGVGRTGGATGSAAEGTGEGLASGRLAMTVALAGSRTTTSCLLPSETWALDMLPMRRSKALPVVAFSEASESQT